MAKKRDRYEITGNMSANGQSLKGIVVVDHGPCGYAGCTTAKDGSKLSKKDMYLQKFKFEDPKAGKALGLPKDLMEFHFNKKDISVFLTKKEDL